MGYVSFREGSCYVVVVCVFFRKELGFESSILRHNLC